MASSWANREGIPVPPAVLASANTRLPRRGLRPRATAGGVSGLRERRWTRLRRPCGRLSGRRKTQNVKCQHWKHRRTGMPGHFHPGLPLLARIRQPPSTSFATHLLRVCCTSHATPRVQCPDGAEPNRSLRRVRPAPRRRVRRTVRSSRPSTVPSS